MCATSKVWSNISDANLQKTSFDMISQVRLHDRPYFCVVSKVNIYGRRVPVVGQNISTNVRKSKWQHEICLSQYYEVVVVEKKTNKVKTTSTV